jgi:hypothetical protein
VGVAQPPPDAVVDLVPFILVAAVERSIPFYEALGFKVIKRHELDGRLEFAGLEATPAAKVMLARVDEVPETGTNPQAPGFLYLYTSNLGRSARGLSASVTTRTRSRKAQRRDRIGRCVSVTQTATATWSPSSSRARSGETPTDDAGWTARRDELGVHGGLRRADHRGRCASDWAAFTHAKRAVTLALGTAEPPPTLAASSAAS